MNSKKILNIVESIDQYVIELNEEKINQLYQSTQQADNEYEDTPILVDCISMSYNIIVGQLIDSLKSNKTMKNLFCLDSINQYKENNNIQEYINKVNNNITNLSETPLNQLTILLCGITFLNLYVQINWTGPTIDVSDEYNFINDNKDILSLLEVDGEVVYTKAKNPIFLLLSKLCLVDSYSMLGDCKSSCWWSCRSILYHQKSLANPTPTFKTLLNERFQIVTRFYSLDILLSNGDDEMDTTTTTTTKSTKEINTLKDLSTKAIIEKSLVFNYFRQLNKIKESIDRACESSELQCALTGAMGKRTRFQTFDTAQLVMEIKSCRPRDQEEQNGGEGELSDKFDRESRISREVTNDDPTLLVRPSLVEEVAGQNSVLRNVDQMLILLQCLNVKNQNGNNGLTTEEMMPYISKTLEKSNNWLIHSMGLLIKSRLEIVSSKTAERAVLQIQALVDQFNDESSSGNERMQYIYSLDYPSRWEMEKEVAERFIGIGAAASAFEIFERLEMWDEAIKCLTFMGKNARSEELVLQRIAIQPTPELYCVLGDIKSDPQFYIQGWELSKKRYSRAQRALARYHLEREHYQESIDCFQTALAINPLFPNSWFSLGCAAMRIEQWETALNAFSRVVSLEPEEGEGWANLASIYMYQKKMDKASSALMEGLKHKRENWKMWENFLYCCMATRDFQNAVIAMNHIFDLNNKKVDIKMISLIADHVISDSYDKQSINGRHMEKTVSELFGRLTSKLTNNPDLWSVYSSYHYRLGNSDKAIDIQQKACRACETASWEGEQSTFEKVVAFTTRLVDLYLEFPNASNVYSAKLKVKGILKKCESSWRETENYKNLELILIKLNEKESELLKNK